MRIMISQPMKGKSTERVRKEREHVVATLESQGHTVVDTVFTDTPPDTNNVALWHLGKSLEVMSTVDAVCFMDGWQKARGCFIEYEAAKNYGLMIIFGDGRMVFND